MTTTAVGAGGTTPRDAGVARPPAWLVLATGLLALSTLAMAVAETNLWMHYLIDAGESISLVGLAFMLAAGLFLYTRGRLLVSLPLALPWLLFPVITQGDQIIDNLSITWMRIISHVLLGALFGFPVAVVVMALRSAAPAGRAGDPPGWMALLPGLRQLRTGRTREGSALLAASLLVAEMWVAVQFLGLLMVVTLVVMIWAVLAVGFSAASDAVPSGDARRGERLALLLLLAGVVASLGLFVGFKNRPGAYQGSPSYYMDPSQAAAGFQLDRIPVPARAAGAPADATNVRAALTGYARAFDELLAGYYILDRNYNYDFHNRLFLRSTPLLANYRAVGLQRVAAANRVRGEADLAAAAALRTLGGDDPLAALILDTRDYAAFSFDRAALLERLSAEFERTEAGLQHATHIYEGEGKVLGVRLAEMLDKHRAVLSAPPVAPLTAEFVSISRGVHDAYANRIVGF